MLMAARAMRTSASSALISLTRSGVRPDTRRGLLQRRLSPELHDMDRSYEEGSRST